MTGAMVAGALLVGFVLGWLRGRDMAYRAIWRHWWRDLTERG